LNLKDRIDAFARLGEFLRSELQEADPGKLPPDSPAESLFRSNGLRRLVAEAGEQNPWFTPYSIYQAMRDIGRMVEQEHLLEWISRYAERGLEPGEMKNIGTILAGNIPMVGFHDFLSILISGHVFTGKPSGKDDMLLPFLSEQLSEIQPAFSKRICFVEEKLGRVDAIIATGSNNTSRYFQYYFGKYPHIFRQNRNGVAVLGGQETPDELAALADDIFLYFGLGCRNVAKLYVPEGYDFSCFFPAMEKYASLRDHHKYANNYLYRQSILLLNQVEHLDNGFLLLCRDSGFSSPVSMLFHEAYPDLPAVDRQLADNRSAIQCVVSSVSLTTPHSSFGQSQHPPLWEYADDVDTLKFLSNLS
jgi:hypothetical protein